MRASNWESKLAELITAARAKEFAWGTHDCCTLVCDVIQALTGHDVYEKFREKYSDRASMAAAIREYGSLAELAEQVAKQHGLEEVPVKLAGRGDVVLVNEGKYDSLAIVEGTHALGASDKGLARVQRKSWLKAWKVN